MSLQIGSAKRIRDLQRITHALLAAADLLKAFTPYSSLPKINRKANGDLVTDADRAVDDLLRGMLQSGDEGWLSEETHDDLQRLLCQRLWMVDPIDGTKEFIAGIPEWCISIGLIEDRRAVAGGICNPATGEVFVGSVEDGITVRGASPKLMRDPFPTILASRSEVQRGEWKQFSDFPLTIVPMGSVAYKLARVAAGFADATWTLVPKHEWDVAAGAALVLASGGSVETLEGEEPLFISKIPLFKGLVATAAGASNQLLGTDRAC